MNERDNLLNHNDNHNRIEGGATVLSGIFNIVNTIIGGGALSLPFVMKESGVGWGIILVVIVAVLSLYSQRLIVDASYSAFGRAKTYGELGTKAFGSWGRYYTEGCIILFLIGAQVSYLVIIGQLITPLLKDWGLDTEPRVVSGVIAAVIIFPVSSFPRMDTLKYTSFIALFFIFCLVIGVLVVSSRELHDNGISGEFVWFGSWQGIFVAIPILNFAFTFHPSVPPVWRELADPSPKNINFICFVSIVICAIFYFVLGLFGYLYYYENSPGNILTAFEGDYLFIALKFGYAFVIVFSYPVLNFATRNGIDSLLFKTDKVPPWRYVIEAALIVGITYIISIFVPSIDIIFGFTGSTVGQLVIFINPALFYLFLYDSAPYDEYNEAYGTTSSTETRRELNWRFFCTPSKLPAIILIIAGLVCGTVSVIEIVRTLPPTSPPNNSSSAGY